MHRAIQTVGAFQKVVLYLSVVLLWFSAPGLAGQYETIILPPPILSSQNFPCTRCHDQKIQSDEKDGQDVHGAIPSQGHLQDSYDCFSCHDREDLDMLRLFDGGKLTLQDSSRLCGQCHSTSYTLWQSGLHGKIVGKWNGPKQITPCATCHNPHRPAFALQNPLPPPTPPEMTLRGNR